MFPANAMSFATIMLQIATFSFINTNEWIDPYIYYLPEDDQGNINLKQCGYDSLLVISNISSVIWMFVAHFFFAAILFGPIWAIHKCSGRLASAKEYLSGYFFWNGLIRLIIESTFDIALATILNMSTVTWDSSYPAVKASTAISIIGLILICLTYPALVLKYYKNFSILAEKWFNDHYGSGLEGTKHLLKKPRKSILGVPVLFFARRILFAVSVILLEDFFWA